MYKNKYGLVKGIAQQWFSKINTYNKHKYKKTIPQKLDSGLPK